MSVHTPVAHPGIYFITFTCYKWLPLIEVTNAYDEVLNFFSILNKNGHSVVGYVIMPNHVHLLQYYNGGKQSLNTITGNGKRFIGYEIVRRLENQEAQHLLSILERGVPPAERWGHNKKHQVWEGTFDVKYCWTEKFIEQKLNYIHQNPCAKIWNLAPDICSYPYSSAAFYCKGDFSNPYVTNYRDILADDAYKL